MSNSHLKALYNSYPSGYAFEISKINEAMGAFSGSYVKHKSATEQISGYFGFNKEKQQTDLVFETSTEKFVMMAAYRSGETYFETWHGTRTSKVNGNDVQPLEFNVDLSGESRSWFGQVGSHYSGGEDL
ncbi:hypothetical protein [Pseudomonas sp. NPDC086278]|uniref:hypothetical protein n=1 Tax=Pseudomonas sp. NPDC086278 TaxID=3390646 RepID=UPI003D000DFA